MCGFFGEFGPSIASVLQTGFVPGAMRAIKRRGPDADGVYQDAYVVMGHARLAVIDLDPRSTQPMQSAAGRHVLAFNGEIYNFRDLQERLPAPPGGWRTTSDTEVLLQGFAARGEGFLDATLGMFAFAFWDRLERRLWLVRDRLGKKPLYWCRTRHGHLRFASEIPALMADDSVAAETSIPLISQFLQYGFISGTRTGFSPIRKVRPGGILEAWLEGDVVRVRERTYWSLPSPALAMCHADWLASFRATLEDAVRIRLVSDVPLGTFLSGGVDSSVVSLIASRLLGRNTLKTYLADFEGDRFSEKKWADQVARSIGSEHHVLRVLEDDRNPAADVVEVYADLFGDPSAIPTIHLCAHMRRHITVALSGDGGDELLCGYQRHRTALRSLDRWKNQPLAIGLARRLAGILPDWLRGTARLANVDSDLATLYAALLRAYPTRPVPGVIRKPSGFEDPLMASMQAHADADDLHRLLWCDMENYLPDNNFMKVDRASMAVGLEVRSPLVDHRLVELVATARPDWIFDAAGGKRPLRELYAGQLPDAVFLRPKMGFLPPIATWLRRMGPDRIHAQVAASGLSSLLDMNEVGKQIRAFHLGLHIQYGRVWCLLVAAEWWNRWNPRLVDGHPTD